jgi:hypothetical protein
MRSILLSIVLVATCICESSAAAESTATIYFFRAKCPPVAVKGTLSIDGVKHSVVSVRRFAVVRVTPGKHELKFSFPMWAGTPSKKTSIETSSDSVRYFYYTTDMGFMIGAPVPTSTITPELIEISEAGAKQLMIEFEQVP